VGPDHALFDDLTLARADGTYGRLLGKLARMDVLVLDDWGLAPPQDQERRDLLEILEHQYGSRSTIVTSQRPPAQWHDHLADPTLADAICDRLLHNAHRIVLQGPSRRKGARRLSGRQRRSAPITIPDRGVQLRRNTHKYKLVPEGTPGGPPYNVAQAYARAADALRGGGSFDVDFNLAVQRHKLIDAIERSSATGQSVRLNR
jgi:hypothetical protein